MFLVVCLFADCFVRKFIKEYISYILNSQYRCAKMVKSFALALLMNKQCSFTFNAFSAAYAYHYIYMYIAVGLRMKYSKVCT